MGGNGVIDLTQDKVKCWKLANSAMNLRFPQNVGNFPTRWGTVRFSGRTVSWRYSNKAHGCEGWVNCWDTSQTISNRLPHTSSNHSILRRHTASFNVYVIRLRIQAVDGKSDNCSLSSTFTPREITRATNVSSLQHSWTTKVIKQDPNTTSKQNIAAPVY